jgi:hypothetical protein
MPPRDLKNIMADYSQATMASHPFECHRDNLRENGFPVDAANKIALRAADVTKRTLDEQQDTLASSSQGRPTADERPDKGAPPSRPWLRLD